MPKGCYRNPPGKINVLISLLIPYAAALPFDRNKVSRCVNWQNNVVKRRPGNCRLFICHLMPIHFCEI